MARRDCFAEGLGKWTMLSRRRPHGDFVEAHFGATDPFVLSICLYRRDVVALSVLLQTVTRYRLC